MPAWLIIVVEDIVKYGPAVFTDLSRLLVTFPDNTEAYKIGKALEVMAKDLNYLSVFINDYAAQSAKNASAQPIDTTSPGAVPAPGSGGA